MSTEDNEYKVYISFGQVHTHSVNGKTFDKDCLAVIKCKDYEQGRKLAFEYFDSTWCMSYSQTELDASAVLEYFPRGLMEVN